MKTKTIKVRVTLMEELLGTASNNPELHREFIASKAEDARKIEDEIEALGVEGVVEKTTTVFPRNGDGTPILWDYQIKGFMKDAAGVLRKVPGSSCSKVKAFKKEIDGLLFVYPRRIPLQLTGGIGKCERPLRASTPMGERVALASSEAVPAGTWFDMEIECMTDAMYDLAKECLDYGCKRGLGQWRNSGKGRFTYEILAD